MQKQLEALIALQHVDTQIKQLEMEKGDLPHIVENLRREMDHLTRDLQDRRAQREERQKKRHATDGELVLLTEQLKKYQKQLYSVVTSNKEYDAITSEIESAEKKIDEMETEILILEEQEEKLGDSIVELQRQIEGTSERLKESEALLQVRLAETEELEKDLAQRREQLIGQVSKPVFSQYERIRKAKDGLAVVAVKNSACLGCFSTIPPQRGLEIRQRGHMILCETCGRILVWENGT